MEVTDRHYPYPVLGGRAGVFSEECHFDVTCEMSHNSKQIKISIQVDLKEPEIENRIKNGYAKLIVHLECPITAYREVRDINLTDVNELMLEHGRVAGEIQICVFVVATKVIAGYTSKSFLGFYAGRRFDVGIGGRLAVAPHIKYSILTRDKRLSNSQSLIVYSPETDANSKEIRVATNSEQIVILVPSQLLGIVKLMNQDVHTISAQSKKNYLLIRALVIVPALVELLGQLACSEKDPNGKRILSEYSDDKWFAYINGKVEEYLAKNRCGNDDSKDLYDVDFRKYTALSIAQFIAEEPFVPALERIQKIA